jgi:hypothetical protein
MPTGLRSSSSSYERHTAVAYAVSPNVCTELPDRIPLSSRKYYAIRIGRAPSPTIVRSWPECSALVTGFSRAEFRSFCQLRDAEAYLDPPPMQNASISCSPSDKETAEDRLMAVKNLNLRPLRWFGTRTPLQQDSECDTECAKDDGSDACYILHDDAESTHPLPLVTSVLFGLYKGAENKPLNALATPWLPQQTKTRLEKENEKLNDFQIHLELHQSKRFNKNTNPIAYTESKSREFHNSGKPETLGRRKDDRRQPTCPLVLPAFCSQPQQDTSHSLIAEGFDVGNKTSPHDDTALSFLDYVSLPKIYAQIKSKIRQVQDLENKGQKGNWMFYDSGASRTVIQSDSPLRSLLTQVKPTTGSCTVGSGIQLPYLESGVLMEHNPVTVVDGLHFDLYSAVSSAKRGISAVIDFDLKTGVNKSFTFCKQTGEVFSLIERKQGVLELPLHLAINRNGTAGLFAGDNQPYCMAAPDAPVSHSTEQQRHPTTEHPDHRKPYTSRVLMRPYHISAFWRALDDKNLSLTHRSSNTTQMALFTFDIVNSLSDKERDFLIHARLAHLPSKQILKLIKQGNTGLPYSGKFAELCRPCLEARHKAHNKNKLATRNANGNIGEHLHSDLAIVSTRDFHGFKYVLTIVDEISAEVVVILLKDKTADSVLHACKRAHSLITSRARSTLRTWQFLSYKHNYNPYYSY